MGEEFDKKLTKVIKTLTIKVTSVNGIENVASVDTDDVCIKISFGETLQHIIQLQADRQFNKYRLPEYKLCTTKFEICLGDIVWDRNKLLFVLLKQKHKNMRHLLLENVKQLSHGFINIELEKEEKIGSAEILVKQIPLNIGFQLTLYFRNATLNATLEWSDSVAFSHRGVETREENIVIERNNFLNIELIDLKSILFPKTKQVLEEEGDEATYVKLLDDRCVVPYLLTKFTEISEIPLNEIKMAMRAKGDYLITEHSSISNGDEDASDFLKNLGESTKWKLDLTVAMKEEFSCNVMWLKTLDPKKLKNMEIITLKRAVEQYYAQDTTKKRMRFRDEQNIKKEKVIKLPDMFKNILGTKKRRAMRYKAHEEPAIPPNIPYLYSGRRSIIAALKQINWGHSEGPFLYNKSVESDFL